EGKMDDQTSFGKAIAGIAQIGKRHGIPVIAIAGADKVTNEAVYDEGVTSVFTLPDGPMQLETAMQEGARLTEKVTTNIMILYAALLNYKLEKYTKTKHQNLEVKLMFGFKFVYGSLKSSYLC